MTFSIVAAGVHRGSPAYGVAVASKFLAVGALVPAAAPGVGALATQSLANQAWRAQGLALLRSGVSAAELVRRLVAGDQHREDRQLGVVDAHGGSASHTGAGCEPWAGHATAPGVAVQGNCLAGPAVVAAALAAATGEDPLERRLLAGLAAGGAAGGDKRGRQSAALLIGSDAGGYDGADIAVDLRVDDHPDPVPELARLLGLHELYAGPPEGVQPLAGPLGAEVDGLVARSGAGSLRRWVELENFEMRWSEEGIDERVLAALRTAGATT